jgi:hypothetical protein
MDNNIVSLLADKILNHPELIQSQPCYVSVYRVDRCYGGPEEGGWWYKRYVLEGSLPFANPTAAESWLDVAKAEVEAENARTAPERYRAMAALPDHETAYHDEGYIPNGWSDGGELWVTIESSSGMHDTTCQPVPRYE